MSAAADAGPGPPKVFALLPLPDGGLAVGTYGRGIVRCGVDSTWAPVIEGPGTGSINALAMADGMVLAGTNGSGVHRSADGGRTWSVLGRGLESTTIYALAQVGDTQIAGLRAGGVAWLDPNDSIWRVLDPDHPLASTSVYRLLPTGSDAVQVATEGSGVWLLSAPPGDLQVLAAGLAGSTVHALTALADGTILAGTSGAGVHRSDDSGHRWVSASDGLPDPVVHSLAGCPDGGVLAGTGAGVAASVDGGRTWAPAGTGLAGRRIFSLAADRGGNTYAGSYDGVWCRASGADNWTRLDIGLAAADVYSVAVSPNGGFVAGGSGHVWFSPDGEAWDGAGDAVSGRAVHGFGRMPGSGGWLAATERGVLISRTDGAWSPAGLDEHCVLGVAATGDGRMLAGTLGGGLWWSENGGRSWSHEPRVPAPLVPDVVGISDGRVLTAAVDARSGVKTGGVYALDGDRVLRLDVPDIACYRIVEDVTGRLVVGAQRCTILVSTNGGSTWQTYDTTGLVDCKLYALAVGSRGDIYIGTDAGVLCSNDGAATWRDCSAGLDGATPYGLAVDEAGTLVAGTSRGLRKWRPSKSAWD